MAIASKAAAALVIVAMTAALGCGAHPLSSGADASVDAADASDGRMRVGGCGKPLPNGQQATVAGTPKGYTHYTVMGTGATLAGAAPQKAGPRTFWVRVPPDYDPDRAYRVVYIGQGCGGYNTANVSTFQLFKEAQGGTEQAIYVALDIPTDMANQDCYDTNDGPGSQEWEAFEFFHTVVDDTYCVDNDQIFVAGFSAGAALANMWGCYFAGDGQHPWNGVPGGTADATGEPPRRFAPKYHVRGQAAVAGDYPDNNPPCNGPVAAIWIEHPISTGYADMLTRVLQMNGCDSETRPTRPWHPDIVGTDVCVQYVDCPKAFPVVQCKLAVNQADDHERAIPAFKLFFDEATASP